MQFQIVKMSGPVWGNRKEGTAEGGTPRELFLNTTQKRIDTYPKCIQAGSDTYQNALFLHSNKENHAQVPGVHECTFLVPPCEVPPPLDNSDVLDPAKTYILRLSGHHSVFSVHGRMVH